jgi:hypothetical protein
MWAIHRRDAIRQVDRGDVETARQLKVDGNRAASVVVAAPLKYLSCTSC